MGNTNRNHKNAEKKFFFKNWTSNPRNLTIIFSVIIALSAFLLYSKTINYQFIHLDEDKLIIEKETYNRDLKNIPIAFTQTLEKRSPFYRPILRIILIIEAHIGKLDPTVYHITNILLHILTSVLLFILLLKLKFEKIGSFFVSMLFVSHPVLTPAVAWVFGRNDSMVALFIILSFIFIIKYYESKDSKSFVFLMITALFYSLALFTKEIAIIFPFIISYYILLIRKEELKSKKNIILILSWIVISLIWFVLRNKALSEVTSPEDAVGFKVFIESLPAIFSMISKVFIPLKLTGIASFTAFSTITGLVFFIILVTLPFFYKQIDKSWYYFGLLWIVLYILPTLIAKLQDDFFDYAEHRVYLPIFGFLLIILQVIELKKVNFKKYSAIAISVIILLACFSYTFAYQGKYKNRLVYWKHFVTNYPKVADGYLNFGLALYDYGYLEKSEQAYLKGIALKPLNNRIYINLAALFIKQGEYQKAEYYSNEAIKLDPSDQRAYHNYAQSLLYQRKFDEAILALRQCLDLGDYPNAYIDIGYCEQQLGNYEDRKSVV